MKRIKISLAALAVIFATASAFSPKLLINDGWYEPDSSGTFVGTTKPTTDCPDQTSTLCATHYTNNQADDSITTRATN